jgi:hypothetical protein
MLMFFIYSKDYVKYLNDVRSVRLTYDQWKELVLKHEQGNSKESNNEKDHDHYWNKV